MTIVNVALPELARSLDVDPESAATDIQWVVTGYLLSLAVFIPVSGWLGDRFGTKAIFMTALVIFTSASLACGLAWNLESLIAFRVLQGVGGGMLTPVGTAMLFRAFPPHERAKAASILMIPMVVGPASGPVLGGYLVEFHSWRLIFLINIPIGILGLIFAGLFLKEERQDAPGRLDAPGLLATLIYGLAQAGQNGIGDPQVLLFGGFGLATLVVFTLVEYFAEEPMIDVRLFANKLFSAANAVQLIGFSALMGGLFLLPLLLQAEMGLSPFESGLTTFPQAIDGGARRHFGDDAGVPLGRPRNEPVDDPRHHVRPRLLLLVPHHLAADGDVRDDQPADDGPPMMGRASAISSAGRQVGASFGVALLATVLTSRLAAHDTALGPAADTGAALDAFHEAFVVAAVLAAVGAIAALLVSDEDAAVSMNAAEMPADEPPEAEGAGAPVSAGR